MHLNPSSEILLDSKQKVMIIGTQDNLIQFNASEENDA
jgi:hypothetical protein